MTTLAIPLDQFEQALRLGWTPRHLLEDSNPTQVVCEWLCECPERMPDDDAGIAPFVPPTARPPRLDPYRFGKMFDSYFSFFGGR